MASVFAKKKLLDIAPGMGKKKTEEELEQERFVPKDDAQVRAAIQQNDRDKVLNNLKNSKLAGASVQTGAQAAAASVNNYAQNRNDIKELESKIADTERYMQIKYPYIPAERVTWTHEGQKSNISPDAKETRDYLYKLYNERNSKQNAIDRMDQLVPSVGKEYDAVRNTLNRANRTVVNPWQDPAPMKGEVKVLRNTAASYEPGSWQADRQGTLATQLADELEYRIGVIEDPVKALEETNADIAWLEDAKQKANGGNYMGVTAKEIENSLEKAYQKRTLLESKTYDTEAAAHQRNMLEIANNETVPVRTNKDFLSEVGRNGIETLLVYGIPEGTTYADYDADDWMDTIHLGSAEAVKGYYALKRNDPELAKQVLEAMQPTINENRARKQVENAAELTERMPITANVLAVGANLYQPVGSLYALAQQAAGKDVDPNSGWYTFSRFTGAVRGTTESMIEEAAKKPAWEKVLKTTYKVGTSIADNMARMLLYRGLGLSGTAGTAVMAASTYGDNVAQAIESGALQGEAALVAAIDVALEFATEVMPTNTYMRLLDSKDAKGMRAIMHDVAEAVLGDGFGEAANSAIGTAAENWIIENGGSIDEAANLYMFRGEAKDYEEAVRMAWKDAMGAALYEGMMGALSAGLLSGSIDAVQSGSAQVQKWLDNRKATKQAAQEAQQTEQAAQEAEAPAQEAPAEEMGKVTLESMAQEMAAQSAPKPVAKVTVQTPQEYAAAQDLKEKAQKAKETKPVLSKGGAVVTAADNGYTVEKDGQNVNLEDLDAQSKEARMLNAAPDMTQDAANDMLSQYDEQENADAQDYAKGYKAVYDAALNGKTLEDAQGLYADELTDAQRQNAYQMGVQARTVENTRTEHLTRQIASRNGFRARTSGDGVSLENVTSNLSAEDVNTFKLLDAFGKRFGLSIQIYDTLAGGRANASYQEGTNVVKIARDAEGGAIVRAASHEVYHYLESFSKEDAQKIRAFVLDKLQNNEEFDLDGLRNEYAARYANVQGADVDAEIVADSLLDVIGTEENIKAMAKDNPSLLSRIVDVIQRIREFLRGQLERLAGNSELVDTILRDEEMLSQIQSMAQQGLENARANRDAGSRVTEMAMQDADVQEYMADLGNAENEAERANMLESLAQKKYAATQAGVYMETGDYEGGYEAWRQALKDFADQKGALNALLKDAGLATTQSQQENAVLALIGRELKRVDESGVRADKTDTIYGKDGEALAEVNDGGAVKNSLRAKPEDKYSQKQHASNNWFMQNTYDQNVREAGELIEDLYRAREAIGRYEGDKVSNRTWDGVARNVAERLKLDTGSDIDQKRLQSRIKKMYEALDKHGTNIYEAMDYAGSIAEELAQKVDMEEDEQYREIRDRFKAHRYYLSPEMASEIRATYGNVQTFMRKHFGKAKFTTSDSKATGLENIWGELSDEMPHIFKEDAKPSEMVMIVDAFLEDANTRRKEQYHSATINQLRADVAMELFWNYYNTPGVLPTAKSVEELKMQMLKTTSFKDMHFQRYLDAESLRNRLQEQLKEAREGYKLKYMEKVKAFDARENKKEQVKTLTRTSTFIKKRLVHPTREKHIPDGLQQVTAVLADIIDNAGGENGRKYAELKALLLELEKKDADVMMNINGGIYAEGGALDVLMQKAGSNSLMRMSNEELAVLRDVAKNIRHACVVADQLRMEGMTGSVSQIATEMHKEFAQREDRKPTGELKKTLKNLNYHLMDAPRYFRELARFAGKGARDMWTIVRGAEDQKVRNLEEAAKLFEEKIGKYDYEKWTGDKAEKHTVQVEGEKIELSTGQLMCLYALDQRDAALSHIYGVQDPATKALEGGGIVASRVKTKDGYVEGVKPRRVTHAHTAEMFKLLTKEQKECANALMEIMSTWCSDKANQVSEALYGIRLYLEKLYIPIVVWQGKKDVHGEEHNMGTMFRLMNKSWTNQLVEKSAEPIVIGDIFDVTMKHVNEVCMYNAWAGAVTDMIRLMNYKAKPLATWDDKANKVVQWINKDFGEGSIREDIVRTMGDEAYRWMEQLIKDVNGTVVNRPESDFAKLANKGIRNYKTSKVLNNLGTAVKQPTSIVRAMDVIPAKYFVGKVDLSKEKLELMRKYAPVARWKDWGFFTMDTGRSTESVLLPKKRKAINKLSDGGMFLAGMGDTVTWMNIWAAAERQVKETNKDLDVGSEAFYQKVAKVFSDCIDRTQTVDSLLHRSELMRQNSFGVKMITTFMGEPLKQYNELMDAYLEYKHGNSVSAKRALAKGAWQFTRAAIVAAAVDSLVAALRNLNDDDPFWKQWLARFAGNYEEDMTAAEMAGEFIFSSVGSQLNVLNYVPIARDWVEQVQGYDVTRADMGTMDAFMDAAKGIFNEKKSIASRISTLIGALGDIVGLGTTNVIKEAKRVWNFINVTGEKIGMDTVPMQYALLRWEKKLGVTTNSSAYADLILKAEEQGRMDMADEIRKDMLEAGFEEEYIDSKMYKLQVEDLTGIKDASYEKTYAALGAAMKAGDKNLQAALTKELKRAGRTDEQIESGLVNWLKEDPRVISAAQKAVNGNTTEKAQLVKTLSAEGYSDTVAKKAINQLQDKLVSDAKKANTKEEEKPKEPEYEALYTTYDLQTAIENGSDVDDIMEDLRKQGKSDTSIKSSLTSAIKPVYIALMNGTASDKQQAKKLKQRLMQLDLENKYTSDAIDKWLK